MPETKNGYKDKDGCADEVPKAVAKFAGVIKGIYFDVDKDTIKPISFPVLDEVVNVLKARPDNYIAQPTLSLSTCPTYVESGIAPRHIDLRPFVLSGKTVQMVPGGLTRVALKEGSLVVNSSQGGGTKDTWVLEN